MSKILEFSDRQAFRKWLEKNSSASEGIWLLFGKKGGPETLSANDALEEALCFGWIDGVMRSIDETKNTLLGVLQKAAGQTRIKNLRKL